MFKKIFYYPEDKKTVKIDQIEWLEPDEKNYYFFEVIKNDGTKIAYFVGDTPNQDRTNNFSYVLTKKKKFYGTLLNAKKHFSGFTDMVILI